MAGQSELTRVARRPDGRIVVGRDEPGRGAWLCSGSRSCFDAALGRKALDRALRVADVGRPALSAAEVERLRARLFGAVVRG